MGEEEVSNYSLKARFEFLYRIKIILFYYQDHCKSITFLIISVIIILYFKMYLKIVKIQRQRFYHTSVFEELNKFVCFNLRLNRVLA